MSLKTYGRAAAESLPRLGELQARHKRVAEIIAAIESDRKPMQLRYIGRPQTR